MASNEIWVRHNQAFRVTLNFIETDVQNNRSYWWWAAEHYQGGWSFGPGNYWSLSGFATANSHQWTLDYDGWRTLGSGYFWKTHNSDGTLAPGNLSLHISTDNEYVIPNGSATVSVSSGTVPSIPRGPKVNVGGTWKNSIAYVNDNGTWKVAIPYVRDNSGNWKVAGG